MVLPGVVLPTLPSVRVDQLVDPPYWLSAQVAGVGMALANRLVQAGSTHGLLELFSLKTRGEPYAGAQASMGAMQAASNWGKHRMPRRFMG